MKKKGIKIILLVLVFISFLITLWGYYTIYLYDYKVDVTAQKVMKEIEEDLAYETRVEQNKEENIQISALGVIIFESGKMVAINDNPTDYNMSIGVGKIIDDSILNESGNSIILGHNDVGFTELKNIKINDTFKIKTISKEVAYKVTDIYITEKEDANPYRSSESIMVTLITCYPFHYIGETNKRYVVVGKSI